MYLDKFGHVSCNHLWPHSIWLNLQISDGISYQFIIGEVIFFPVSSDLHLDNYY